MANEHPSYYDEHRGNIKRVAELINEVEVCMLSTVHDGSFISRPMRKNDKAEFNGDLWFFTFGQARKAEDVRSNPHVNVAFARPDDQIWISIQGEAEVVEDRGKMEELWEPTLKPWFPEGTDTPDLALLKVTAHGAEYWDGSKSYTKVAFEAAKSLVTNEPPDIGDDEKLTLK